MNFRIEVVKNVEPGTYDVKIVDLEIMDSKYGERLKIGFELDDGSFVYGFFPPKATQSNKTGKLFESALGECRSANSDELIGKTVKVLVEEELSGGRIYSNVTDIIQ